MGEDGASDARGRMATEEGEAVITTEKVGPDPMMTKPEAGAEDSFLAPSQFTISVATVHNH